MRALVAIALASTLGACRDDCIDGICPDLDETRAFPGPCRSAGFAAGDEGGSETTTAGKFEYDAAGRIVLATYEEHTSTSGVGGSQRIDDGTSTTWSYDAAGNVSGVASQGFSLPDREPTSASTWTFTDADVVHSFGQYRRIYDRDLFAFAPLIGDNVVFPSAELGLIEDTQQGLRYSWTVESPTVWVSHVENSLVSWRYVIDDRHRVVTRTWSNGTDLPVVAVWTYDEQGNLISNPSDTMFKYDRAGNIAEIDGGLRIVFDYSCW